MKLILPQVQILYQEKGINGVFKAISQAGRVCYASTREGDEEEFVQRCIRMNHMRPLEFGTVYLKFDKSDKDVPFYKKNPYSKVVCDKDYAYITTNYRVIIENNRLKDIKFLVEPTLHKKRITFLWTISRGIADEFRTHVSLSSLMESTRYCAYNKDKFNNEITFIIPTWMMCDDYLSLSEEELTIRKEYDIALTQAEEHYLNLTNAGVKAENARGVLPLDIKTTFVQCGFEDDWIHFFDLRSKGTTGKPHPDAKFIADKALELFKEYGNRTQN